MGKYRKKPVVIEAEQWWPPDWWGHRNYDQPDRLGVVFRADDHQSVIHTLEGDHEVSPGDWIVTGVKGEKYPCKPDIFEMTYDKVEE